MELVYRGARFLRNYVFRSPKYTWAFLLIFWQKGFAFRTPLLTEGEFIKEIKNGKSLIRLGDGEINLMRGQRNHYQTFSPVLKKVMFDIVESYSEKSPYLLSVPRFINCTNSELKSMGKLYVWLPLKAMFWIYFKKNIPYLDAHAFYYDGYFERTVGAAIVNKQVILVTKRETIDKQKNNKNIPWKRLDYVVVPETEALSSYESIKNKIEQVINPDEVKETVLLFALGPVGKKIAFEFAKNNIQSIDIGKVAEVMYTGESIEYIV